MPQDNQLTKHGRWGLSLLQGFFGALGKGQLPAFLESDELQRFMNEMREGRFGGKIPDGQPGSKFPGTGALEPLDVLHEMFNSFSSGLGEIDRQGGGDPAAGPDDEGSPNVQRNPDGSIFMTVTHGDGSSDSYRVNRHTSFVVEHSGTDGSSDRTSLTPDGHGGFTVVHSWSHGGTWQESTRHYDRHGHPASPGEDGGGDTNSDNNPLRNIDVRGLGSAEEMLKRLKQADENSEKLDPNTQTGPLKLSEADRERLARTVPALETLDPNSGVDPLSALNLDPTQVHTHTEDDELDPNTGLKPNPTKGGG